MHQRVIRLCSNAQEPHALHGIPELPRTGKLDEKCPTCAGHGQWNNEIDLASQRSKRTICGQCNGLGWIETGDDLVAVQDIILSPDGYPMWITKYRKP